MMKYKWYYWTLLTPMIRASLQDRYSQQLADYTIQKGKPYFQDLLQQADDLGPGNPLECRAYIAYVFVAVWLGSGRLISTKAMAGVMEDVLHKMRPLISLVNINSKKGSKYWYNRMKKYEAWYEEHGKDYPKTWEVHFDENLHEDGSCFYFTQCPVFSHLKRMGIDQMLEPLYDAELLLVKMQHGVLHRDCTLAQGQCKCDYWVVGDKVKDPK